MSKPPVVALQQLNATTWVVTGEMQINTVAELERVGRQMITAAPTEFCVDLNAVSRSDSVGVAVLISWLRLAHQLHKKISYRNLPVKMLNNVRVSGLETVLPLATDLPCSTDLPT